MQEDMKSAQEEIKLISCRGESASGDVKIDINGDYQVTNIELDNSLLSDKEMLEDLIMIAINECVLSSQHNIQRKNEKRNWWIKLTFLNTSLENYYDRKT